MFKGLSESKKLEMGTIFIFLLSSPPMVLELFPFMPGWKVLYLIILPLVFLFYIKNNCRFSKRQTHILLLWLFSWLLLAVYHSDSVYISRCAIALISIVTVSLIDKIGRSVFCRSYIKLILFFAICGAIVFFLVLIVGIQPIFEYENADGRPGFCFLLTCSNSYTGAHGTIRYSGLFDEPGAMGLWGLYAMLLNKLTIDSRKVELLLAICLAFTFSFGFYLGAFIYFILFYSNKKNAPYFIVLAVLLAFAAKFLLDNPFIYNMTVGRMEYDPSSGTFSGDNRADMRVHALEVFKKNVLMGVGATNVTIMAEKGASVSDNIFSPLAKDGLVGVIALYSPFFVTLFKKFGNNVETKCLLVLFSTFFHRSIVFIAFNIILYLILIETIQDYQKQTIFAQPMARH